MSIEAVLVLAFLFIWIALQFFVSLPRTCQGGPKDSLEKCLKVAHEQSEVAIEQSCDKDDSGSCSENEIRESTPLNLIDMSRHESGQSSSNDENVSKERKVTWADIRQRFVENAEKRRANFGKALSLLFKRTEEKPKDAAQGGQNVLRKGGQVRYKIRQSEVVYGQRRWQKIRSDHREFAYQSKSDTLKKDWENVLKKFSDQHPIIYNGCLWTTTSTAKRKLLNGRSKKCAPRPRLIRRSVQSYTVNKSFELQPQLKVVYQVKKEIVVHLHAPSKAQWRPHRSRKARPL